MPISTHKLIVHISDDLKDIASAWLNHANVDAILDTEEGLIIYKEDGNLEEIKSLLKEKLAVSDSDMRIESEERVNWNKEWESNFKPLLIGDIYVRALFHPADTSAKSELLISPKMAFGTGHHETTYMMLEHMQSISFHDKAVLDYGCGTGILSVYAKMAGCDQLTCIDIQEEAIQNTYEHFELNGLAKGNTLIREGDLDIIGENKFDIILANINRQVLLNQYQNLHGLLIPDGLLIISGILKADRQLLLDQYTQSLYTLTSEAGRGEWTRMTFTKL